LGQNPGVVVGAGTNGGHPADLSDTIELLADHNGKVINWLLVPSGGVPGIKVIPHENIPVYSVFGADISYFENNPAKVLTKKWTNGYLMLTNGANELTAGVEGRAYVIGNDPVLVAGDATTPPSIGRTCGIKPDTYTVYRDGHDLFVISQTPTDDYWWVNRPDIQTSVTQDIQISSTYSRPHKRGVPVRHGFAQRLDESGLQLGDSGIAAGLLQGGFGLAEHDQLVKPVIGSSSLRSNFAGISPAVVLITDSSHTYATYTHQSTGIGAELSTRFLTSTQWGPFRILDRDNIDDTVVTYPRFENAIVEFQPTMRIHSCYNINAQAEVSSEYGVFDMTASNAQTALFTGFQDFGPLDAKHIGHNYFVEDYPSPEYLVEIFISGEYNVSNLTEHVVGGNSDIYYVGSADLVTLVVKGVEADTTETLLRSVNSNHSHTALYLGSSNQVVPFTIHTKLRWYHQYEKLKIYLEDGSANVDLLTAATHGTITCIRLSERGVNEDVNHQPGQSLPAANSATFPTGWNPGNSILTGSTTISYANYGSPSVDFEWQFDPEEMSVSILATIVDGTSPFVVTIVGGSLPTGLTHSGTTGDITGDVDADSPTSGFVVIRVVDDDNRIDDTTRIDWEVA